MAVRQLTFVKNIKVITFDVTRTLLDFKISPGLKYAEVANFYGVTIDGDTIVKNFATNYKAMSETCPNFGKNSIGWQRWWEIVIRKSFGNSVKNDMSMEAIASNLINSYSSGNNWILKEGCEDVLTFLKSTPVKLGVVSNFDPRLHGILEDLNLRQYFDFVMASYDVNCAKPDPEIYEEALIASGIRGIGAEEALHIGDDEENDYAGALSAGWRAFLVKKKFESSVAGISVDQNCVFHSLADLQNFFVHNKHIFAK